LCTAAHVFTPLVRCTEVTRRPPSSTLDGADASAKIQGPARDFAEAQIDVLRVRCARERLLCDALNSLHYESRAGDGPKKLASILSQQTKKLLAMGRYERRPVYRRKRAIRALDEARRS
jgi:hypothetical protein